MPSDDVPTAPPPATSPLRAYLDLDLAFDAKVATDLTARVEREAKRGSLSLTGDGDAGAISANLTPEMQSWLGTHVGGKRQAALTAIAAAARQIRGDGKTEGIVADIEEDKLKRECTQRQTDETRRFYDRHKDRIDTLNKLKGEYDAQRADLGDRDAVVPSLMADWGLPLLVAVPEGFMNYGSFVSLAGLGVAGLGLTIVAGIAIGVSAWLAGRFWKAWQFYMRADDDDQQQRGLRMIGLGDRVVDRRARLRRLCAFPDGGGTCGGTAGARLAGAEPGSFDLPAADGQSARLLHRRGADVYHP